MGSEEEGTGTLLLLFESDGGTKLENDDGFDGCIEGLMGGCVEGDSWLLFSMVSNTSFESTLNADVDDSLGG